MSPHQDPKGSDSENKPLAGRTVLVARPQGQQAETAALFEEAGARVVQFAAIEIGPPDDWEPVDEAVDRIGQFSWVVFSSSNGVRFFLGRLKLLGLEPDVALGKTRIAAIGPGTARSLEAFSLRADLIPPVYRAESLADALGARLVAGDRVLLVCASRGRDVLASRLRQLGGEVDHVIAYSSTDATCESSPEVARVGEMMESGRIDWIAVTSSAIGASLTRILGTALLSKSRIAAISPITAESLRLQGIRADAVAHTHDIPGIIEAIAACEAETGQTDR